MLRIRKQFGLKFADALSKSPTLVKDLEELRAAGVKIRRVGGHCQAYTMNERKTIYIGTKCKLGYQLIALAHEKVHMVGSPTQNPVPRVTGRQAFIDHCLDCETDCIVHEVVVANELLAAGVKLDDHSLSWVKRFKRGGRAAIRRAIAKATTSNTGEKYPEYYGGWYDDAIKPKDRLPFVPGEREVPSSAETATSPAGQDLLMDTRLKIRLDIPALDAAVESSFTASNKLPVTRSGRVLCPRGCLTCGS